METAKILVWLSFCTVSSRLPSFGLLENTEKHRWQRTLAIAHVSLLRCSTVFNMLEATVAIQSHPLKPIQASSITQCSKDLLEFVRTAQQRRQAITFCTRLFRTV
jgi:hypothetical protein